MRLSLLCVCVNYADFLAYTLPINKNHFESIVIITDTKDKDTHRVCDMMQVPYIKTDRFYEKGATFKKGAAINEGLKYLKDTSGWYLHMDADILLTPDFKSKLTGMTLNPKGLYGADRWMINTFEEARSTLSASIEGTPLPEHTFQVNRHIQAPNIGYTPIGYFQLWNPIGSGINIYPEKKGDASSDDVHFAYKWSRDNRHLLDLKVYHLDSSSNNQGVNWSGRTTKRFTWDS